EEAGSEGGGGQVRQTAIPLLFSPRRWWPRSGSATPEENSIGFNLGSEETPACWIWFRRPNS
ncbi:hypothetical protein Nmel_008059, partial [Mimus melanotis]